MRTPAFNEVSKHLRELFALDRQAGASEEFIQRKAAILAEELFGFPLTASSVANTDVVKPVEIPVAKVTVGDLDSGVDLTPVAKQNHGRVKVRTTIREVIDWKSFQVPPTGKKACVIPMYTGPDTRVFEHRELAVQLNKDLFGSKPVFDEMLTSCLMTASGLFLIFTVKDKKPSGPGFYAIHGDLAGEYKAAANARTLFDKDGTVYYHRDDLRLSYEGYQKLLQWMHKAWYEIDGVKADNYRLKGVIQRVDPSRLPAPKDKPVAGSVGAKLAEALRTGVKA